jgi:hypothetical protein
VATPLTISLGPEVRENLVPGDAAATGAGKQREKRQRFALRGSSARGAFGPLYTRAAKRPEPQYGPGYER